MSAWDVAGAVVWTSSAVGFIWLARFIWDDIGADTDPGVVANAVMASIVAFAATAGLGIYCIARLCGAHA